MNEYRFFGLYFDYSPIYIYATKNLQKTKETYSGIFIWGTKDLKLEDLNKYKNNSMFYNSELGVFYNHNLDEFLKDIMVEELAGI